MRGLGLVTSVGVGLAQTDAAIRAGLCRFRNRMGAVMAVLADEALGHAVARAESVLAETWHARLAALTGLALRDAASPGSRPVVMLGVADSREGVSLPPEAPFWSAVSSVSDVTVDAARSRLLPQGRAAGFAAHAMASAFRDDNPGVTVIHGAVDSYDEPSRVTREQGHGRTLGGPGASKGRPLGEAAALIDFDAARVETAVVDDPGHRFGQAPARGEGLAHAIEDLRRRGALSQPTRTVWAGLCGERHDAKLWGTACVRHADILRAQTRLEHPADRIGDTGAAHGTVLLALAMAALSSGRRAGPALVWAASDHERCGCAVTA